MNNIICPKCKRTIIIKLNQKYKCVNCYLEFSVNEFVKLERNNSKLIHCRHVLRDLSIKRLYNNYINMESIIEKNNIYKKEIDIKLISQNIKDKKRKSYIFIQQLFDNINNNINILTKENMDKLLFIINEYIMYVMNNINKNFSINYSNLISNITYIFDLDYELKKKIQSRDLKNNKNIDIWNDFLIYFLNKYDNKKKTKVNIEYTFIYKPTKKIEYSKKKYLFFTSNKKISIKNDNTFYCLKKKNESIINLKKNKKISIFIDNKYININKKIPININQNMCFYCGEKNPNLSISNYFVNFKVCNDNCRTTVIYLYKDLDIDSLYKYDKKNIFLFERNNTDKCKLCLKTLLNNSAFCNSLCKESYYYIYHKIKNNTHKLNNLTLPSFILYFSNINIIKEQYNILTYNIYKNEIILNICFI